MECQGGMVVDDRRPPQPIGCRVRCRENRPLHPSTTLYIGLAVSRGICRASTALQQPLRLYSSTALQRSTLYNLCTPPLVRLYMGDRPRALVCVSFPRGTPFATELLTSLLPHHSTTRIYASRGTEP